MKPLIFEEEEEEEEEEVLRSSGVWGSFDQRKINPIYSLLNFIYS
ncbi:hypothetical protein [Mycoplasmoides gallisepticum]|nr:hypothetical protein [Mycoplasmoides gallisepticum]